MQTTIVLSTYHEYQLTYQAVWVGDEEIETKTTRYKRTTEDEWEEVIVADGEDGGGHPIGPIECSVVEDFSVKITDKEVALLKDVEGEIWYE